MEAEPNILKLCAQETVNSYSTSAIHAYTDGSAFKVTINAGFGILLKYPYGSSSEYSDSCGTNCSNYEAEKIAIKTAMQLIHQRFELSESIDRGEDMGDNNKKERSNGLTQNRQTGNGRPQQTIRPTTPHRRHPPGSVNI